MSTAMVTYLAVYVITIIYLVVLGCRMLWHKDNPLSSHGELAAKRRMSRTMGVAMFVVALEWFVYLPPMLSGLHPDDPVYKVFFIAIIMLTTPTIYAVMFAVVQRKVNVVRWTCALGAPFLLLAAWQIIAPRKVTFCYI